MIKQKHFGRHKYWVCPYFRWDGRTQINCDGGCLSFPDTRSAVSYIDSYCANNPNWQQCTVAAAVTDYYERIL